MVTIRRARIKCPHCQKPIIVQDSGDLTREEANRLWQAVDDAFDAVDRAMNKINRMLRRV